MMGFYREDSFPIVIHPYFSERISSPLIRNIPVVGNVEGVVYLPEHAGKDGKRTGWNTFVGYIVAGKPNLEREMKKPRGHSSYLNDYGGLCFTKTKKRLVNGAFPSEM
jgi:hypothetical protein